MEFLQRLAEIVFARIQLKIYDRELLSKYEALFDTELFGINEMIAAYDELVQRDCAEARKYNELVQLCGGTEYARWLADMCLAALLYPEFHDFTMEYWNGVTLDAVSGFVDGDHPYKELKKTAECAERILKCIKKAPLFLRHQFYADARLLDYFLDEYSIDSLLEDVDGEVFTGQEVLEETFVSNKVLEQIQSALENARSHCIQIAGNDGCGKRFLLKKACKNTGLQMLMINMGKIYRKEKRRSVEICLGSCQRRAAFELRHLFLRTDKRPFGRNHFHFCKTGFEAEYSLISLHKS